jgi:DNA-directed RNA polymerase subunit K/omega
MSSEKMETLPMEALVLECVQDRYKVAYAALRWAKEIKQKESLPEPVPHLIPRALREILTGKTNIEEIEKLPPIVKVVAPPPPPAPPTLTLNVAPDDTDLKDDEPLEEKKKSKKKDE